ncbi:MAG: hypothetical protein KH375_08720 [Alistipes sp.]|nr:hypothetical protein [Alistipes sp.]
MHNLKIVRSLFIAVVAILLYGNSEVSAQQYSTDAILVENINGKVAKIDCSGVGDKKKTAEEMAVKSAIYTYLYNGIAGLNNDMPLLGHHPSKEAEDYVNNLMNNGRYSIFVKSYVPKGEPTKNIAKLFQSHITLELYIESLYKDCLNCGVINLNPQNTNLQTTQEEIAIPTIMVVPYCIGTETYQGKIQSNPYIRMAISKVNTGFVKKGVETKDVEQMIRNAEQYQTTHMDIGINEMILANSGADVSVSVDISQNSNQFGTAVSLTLKAVDISTSNTYASVTKNAPRKHASVEVICSALAEVMIDEFLKQIEVGFAKKIAGGNAISISFTIDSQSSVTFDTEVSNFTPLSDAIFQWLRTNAKDGKYHSQGRTKNVMMLDQIQIANKRADGTDMDINDFALELYRFLRSQNLTVERNINGNKIDITIL